jgi:hypothetical protein
MSSELRPLEPWHSFLRVLDEALQSHARLDCIGGFVVTQLYGLARVRRSRASELTQRISMNPLHPMFHTSIQDRAYSSCTARR